MKLLHHYKFDSNTTDSVSGSNLDLVGGATYIDGVSGKALDINGVGKFAVTSKNIQFDGNFSISFWFKTPLPTTNDGWRTFICRWGGGLHPVICDVNSILGVYNQGWYPTDTNYNIGTLSAGWHHLVSIANHIENKTYFYIDGVYVGVSSNKNTFTERLVIGNYNGGGQWAGFMDDVKIYNYLLSLKEVKELYKGLIIHESMKVNVSKWHVNATFYSSFDGKLMDESYNYVTPRNLPLTNVNTKLGPDRFARQNKAAYFDGTAYLDLGNYTTTKEVTYNTWIKLPDTIPARTIAVDHGSNARIIDIYTYNDWEVDIGRAGGWVSINRIVPPADYRGKWLMFTLTINYATGIAKVFFNGVNSNTFSFTAGDNAYQQPIRLGDYSLGTGYKLTGFIDEFMVFNTALPQDTVTHLYNITKNHKLNEPINSTDTADLFKYIRWGVGNECALSYDVINTFKGGQEPWTLSFNVKDVLQSSSDGDSQDIRVGWYGGNYKGPFIVVNKAGQISYSIGQGFTYGSWANYGSSVVYTLTDNNQHHIALLYDGLYVRLYVDGVERHSYNIGVYIDSGNKDQNFRMGSSNPWDNWGGSTTTMKMYDVKLFARALSASEIIDEVKLKYSITKENVGIGSLFVEDKAISAEAVKWSFRDNLNDSHGNFNMIFNGADYAFVGGYKDYALQLRNTTYAYVSKKAFLPNQNFCLSFILTPTLADVTSDSMPWFDMGHDYTNWILCDIHNSRARFYHLAGGGGGNNFYSNTSLVADKTYHIVYDYRDGVKRIFINGVLDNQETATINMTTISDNMDIGRRFDTGTERIFKGLMEDFRIYGRSLDDAEILSLYRSLFIPNIGPKNQISLPCVSASDVQGALYHSASLENPFNGTISGAYLSNGINNNSTSAYYFDGVDDYLETTESYTIDTRYTSYTINVWIKPEAFTGNYGALIMDSSNGGNNATFGIWVFGNSIGAWAGGNLGSWAATGKNLFDGNWHMISTKYTANSSTFTPTRMYCDGVYVGNSTTDRGSYLGYTGKLGYGNSYVGYETNYKGYMANGKIWKKSISDAELLKMYEMNKNKFDKKYNTVNQLIEN